MALSGIESVNCCNLKEVGSLTVEKDLQCHDIGGRAGNQSHRWAERQVAVRYVLPDEIFDDGRRPIFTAITGLARNKRLLG